jgi:hypothetical protein
MIATHVFHERLNTHCKNCEFWKGVCLKGHALQGPAGCPLKKFPPVEGADYLPDLPVPNTAPVATAPKPCCNQGENAPIPEMTWPEVFGHFRSAMQQWKEAGLPLTPDDAYAERVDTCKECPRYHWFHCRICKCIVYTKAKLQTETCPEGRWKR